MVMSCLGTDRLEKILLNSAQEQRAPFPVWLVRNQPHNRSSAQIGHRVFLSPWRGKRGETNFLSAKCSLSHL